MIMTMIEVEGLHLDYQLGRGWREGGQALAAIAGLSLRVGKGESLAIIGPSGCGKTSLLYVLAGLRRPTAGAVRIAGEEVRGPRRDVALILQEIGLLPWKTVWKNVVLGLELNGGLDRAHSAKVEAILRELGLAELRDRYPAQLSGGQKKRVGLARALAVDPAVLLMDEPLAFLDEQTKEEIQDSILQLWQERKEQLTMVLVTHDIEEAVFLGQRIAVLTPRPAQLKAELANPGLGTPDYRRSPEFYELVRKLRELL
jgi:NitT/TauT family transport system ATP-binding protein